MTQYFTSTLIDAPHGFFSRAGGVSVGIWRGLNCGPGSKDDPAAIVENRARASRVLGFAEAGLCTLYQIHSPEVITVTRNWTRAEAPQADAMVTNIPGLLLGILTADCAPVLFADSAAGVVGAAHAGWKGAHAGVLENTMAAMEKLGAKRANITACIGPCIAQPSYEVGEDFIANFSAEQRRFFAPGRRPGHYQFNLPAYVSARLAVLGLQAHSQLAMDTASDEGTFFSYRRTTLRAEPDYGRQISVIGMRE